MRRSTNAQDSKTPPRELHPDAGEVYSKTVKHLVDWQAFLDGPVTTALQQRVIDDMQLSGIGFMLPRPLDGQFARFWVGQRINKGAVVRLAYVDHQGQSRTRTILCRAHCAR